ncbi:FAD/NAD(P)-binding protein [Bradyrhizobium cytisi]|uniref:FAD/NAD(P)-binding protein n=1 Tax=Bradyrhizobium cytisi TaxID=515489 RepID=UPI0016530552
MHVGHVYQLVKRPAAHFRVTLIERGPEIARSVAYHTGNPEHLLNVRVANMSALPDESGHFWQWLCARASTLRSPWPMEGISEETSRFSRPAMMPRP